MNNNDVQNQRKHIMQSVAESLIDCPVVLKGGTSLLLCYGLDRFSEDLDFDILGERFSLEKIKKVIDKAFSNLNIPLNQVIVKKDTETTKRLMYHYDTNGLCSDPYPLKIEFSARQSKQLNLEDIDIVNNVKTYKIAKLAETKFNAFKDRCMPRDIYDMNFIINIYPLAFSNEILEYISNQDIDTLSDTFDIGKEDDKLLEKFEGADLALNLITKAEMLKKRR